MSTLTVSSLTRSRRDFMRRARNAAFYRQGTSGETARVWQKHCAEQVRAARADNRLIVARLREYRSVARFTNRNPAHLR